jgi:hypothetical protein
VGASLGRRIRGESVLGWGIFIYRQIAAADTSARERRPLIGKWEAGLGGLDWLDALVADGRASSFGGDGYPMRYSVSAAVLRSSLESGPPRQSGPLVIGDDYIAPGGWMGEVTIERAALGECPPAEELMIEAWDLS